jgi:hypothetical protein
MTIKILKTIATTFVCLIMAILIAPNAPLVNFKFDHLDIEAQTAGTIADTKNWTITDSTFTTTDGTQPIIPTAPYVSDKKGEKKGGGGYK